MAIWTEFDKKFDVNKLAETVRKKGLAMPSGSIHDRASEREWNAARLGLR